jgi:hypothetical protein
VANRIFSIAAATSTLAVLVIVVAWVGAGRVDAQKHFIRVSSSFHVSVDARGADARLELFNDASPYSGGIVGIAGDPRGPTVSGVGDAAGVYYRMIRWPDGRSVWTLSLSLIYPLVLAAVLPALWIIRRSRGRRRGRRRGFPVEARPASVAARTAMDGQGGAVDS